MGTQQLCSFSPLPQTYSKLDMNSLHALIQAYSSHRNYTVKITMWEKDFRRGALIMNFEDWEISESISRHEEQDYNRQDTAWRCGSMEGILQHTPLRSWRYFSIYSTQKTFSLESSAKSLHYRGTNSWPPRKLCSTVVVACTCSDFRKHMQCDTNCARCGNHSR